MAITKESINLKIEAEECGGWKIVNIQTLVVIKEDDVEISSNSHRHSIVPTADWSNEADDIKVICNAVHTDSAKTAYRAFLEATESVE